MPGAHSNSRTTNSPSGGLPPWERTALNLTFKIAASVLSDAGALKKFRRESKELFRLADDDESYDVFQTLKIPRVIGIEESSRNWSVMMVLDHVCLTTPDMLKIIKALMDGVVPRGTLVLADYKPNPEVGYEVLAQFQRLELEYCRGIELLLESRGNLATKTRYPHPWFGPLNAHHWHCLAAIHHHIHRRQVLKLIAMLGVT